MEAKISKSTELGPSDIIKNRKGKIYRIETFHGDKNNYRISPWPIKAGEENPSYVIISRESLISKQWEKMDKNNLKLPSEELAEEEVEELSEPVVAKKEKDSEDSEEEQEDNKDEDEEEVEEVEDDHILIKDKSSEEDMDY